MSLSRNDTDKHSTYMDGIPVKIGELYKPPKKITLPVGIVNRQTNDSFEEYDFCLERSTVEKMLKLRELRKANVEKRRQRIAAEDKRIEEAAANAKDRKDSKEGITSAHETENAASSVTPSSYVTSSASQATSQASFVISSASHVTSQSSFATSPPLYVTSQASYLTSQASYMPSSTSYVLPESQSHNPMLTPVPINQSIVMNNHDTCFDPCKQGGFNISDFESDSSPFDNMELKTLNDIAELASVLQPNNQSVDDSSQTNQQQQQLQTSVALYNMAPNYGVMKQIIMQPPSLNHQYNDNKRSSNNGVETINHRVNGMALFNNVYNTTTTTSVADNNYWMRQQQAPTMSYASTITTPTSSTNGRSSAAVASHLPANTGSSEYAPQYSWATYRYSQQQQQPMSRDKIESGGGRYVPRVSNPSTTTDLILHRHPTQFNVDSVGVLTEHLSNDCSRAVDSSGVPDLIQQLKLELESKRESDSRRITLQNERILSNRIAAEDEKLKQRSSGRVVSPSPLPPSPVLANPISHLTPSCQKLVRRIAEMGFPLARVARAVERLGDNESEVLEFLFEIQRLEEETGCPGDRVEQALIVNRFDKAESIRYLEILQQLLDLGFVENKVAEALAQHSNDRDKAIEALIS